jgi:hypothetical protein
VAAAEEAVASAVLVAEAQVVVGPVVPGKEMCIFVL